jgi:hypothetical protein
LELGHLNAPLVLELLEDIENTRGNGARTPATLFGASSLAKLAARTITRRPSCLHPDQRS